MNSGIKEIITYSLIVERGNLGSYSLLFSPKVYKKYICGLKEREKEPFKNYYIRENS